MIRDDVIEVDDLIVHLARFAGALREGGIAVGIGDEADAARALVLIDLADRAEVRRSLLIALKIRPRDREAFDEVFARHWTVEEPAAARHVPQLPALGRRAIGQPRPADRPDGVTERESNESRGSLAYSREAALRRKPFEECSARDLADMEQLLARWVPRWAARRSRRLAPVRGRGVPHLRRSFRKALATGGEMLSLAYRARAIDNPRIVVLCDTSGSMDVHVRFLLAFVLALKRVARHTEVFAFNTALTRLTPWLSPGNIASTLDRVSAGVPGWSGGTRIGDSLSEFVAKYAALVGRRTVIVIVSDGLDRGDTSLVASAMRELSAKARRIVWLNPLSGDPRYEPTAKAMQAAMPFIDRFGPAHTLESLERILPELAA
ncbi:MAG TPA: VWA domain-containing protein [Vicinamibacterales bacterium]|nr:VWA domain-containing protein [Vicinamibacterales bacterium]